MMVSAEERRFGGAIRKRRAGCIGGASEVTARATEPGRYDESGSSHGEESGL
jgi:hypothetical protein